jgi:hypothetical protein
MMSVYKTREFKKLQRQYYARLKEQGFQDIEDDNGRMVFYTERLHQLKRFTMDLMGPIRDYYSWALQHAARSEFENSIDEKIWTMHAEGKSSREIAKEVDFDQTWICRKIKKIRNYLRLK